MTACESHWGEYAAPARLCRIDCTKQRQGMYVCVFVSLVGHLSDRLSAMSVRAEPHKGYVAELFSKGGVHVRKSSPDRL